MLAGNNGLRCESGLHNNYEPAEMYTGRGICFIFVYSMGSLCMSFLSGQ